MTHLLCNNIHVNRCKQLEPTNISLTLNYDQNTVEMDRIVHPYLTAMFRVNLQNKHKVVVLSTIFIEFHKWYA